MATRKSTGTSRTPQAEHPAAAPQNPPLDAAEGIELDQITGDLSEAIIALNSIVAIATSAGDQLDEEHGLEAIKALAMIALRRVDVAAIALGEVPAGNFSDEFARLSACTAHDGGRRAMSTIHNVELEAEQVAGIRHALLIGLAAYGEIERLCNARQIRETCGKEVPEDLRAMHPTGAADTVGQFADALRSLENAAPSS
jgi:hypothetical protein